MLPVTTKEAAVHTPPRSKLASAHGRAACFMGDTGRAGMAARFWRRSWGAAVVLEAEGETAARWRLAKSRELDRAVDESMARCEMAARLVRTETAALQRALDEVAP